MKKNWKFDEKFLLKKIERCEELLCGSKINYIDSNHLLNVIDELESYIGLLHGEQYQEKNVNNWDNYNISLQVLGANILEEFHKASKIIPYAYMNWLLELSQEKKELSFVSNSVFTYDIDNTIKNSLEIYKQYFPNFYNTASSFLNYPNNLFHFDKHMDVSSFCFYSKFVEIPLFVINHFEGEDCFIHELQHGIEFVNYHDYLEPLYMELGPMVLERMYADKIYNQGRIEALSCYELELKNFKQDLEFFVSYVNILKEFKRKKYFVSNNEIYSLFEKYDFFCLDNIKDTFCYFLDNSIVERVAYVFSFLKSISLRNEIYKKKSNAEKIILDCSTSCCFPFYNSEKELFDCYKNHLKEIRNKQKILTKTKK